MLTRSLLRTRTLPLMALCLALGCPAVASARGEPPLLPEDPPPLPAGMSEPENAALLYGRALRLLTSDSLKQMAESDEKGEGPSERAVEAIKAHGEMLSLARRAARLKRSDWGIEYQLGPYALLEHAGLMRQMVRALDHEAVLLAPTDIDRSVENVVAMLGMAEHMTQDRLVISTLVGTAMTGLCVKRLGALLDEGRIEPRHAESLLEAIDRVQGTHLFGARDALRTEQWMASEWFRSIGVGPDAGPRVAQMLAMLGVDEDGAILDAIALMNEAQLAPLFDQAAKAYDDMIAALGAEDPLPELTRINATIEAGEYGLITLHFAAAILKIYEPTKRATDSLLEIEERIRALSSRPSLKPSSARPAAQPLVDARTLQCMNPIGRRGSLHT